MKPQQLPRTAFPSRRSFLTMLAVIGSIGFLQPASSHSATVAVLGGTLTADLDQTAFASMYLTTIDYFNQTTSNSLTAAQIQSNAGNSTDVWTGLQFGVNGSSLTSPAGRSLQTTNFTYDPAVSLTGTAAGQIGFGGLPKFNGPLGMLIIGDYSLEYDNARAGGIYSGWYLQNHYSFAADAFDLGNVVTSNVTSSGFDLSGDLIVGPTSGLGPLGFNLAAPDTDVGNFTFHASTVSSAPEPSKALLSLIGLGSMLFVRRRRK